MIESFKGRNWDFGQRVAVYWNIRGGRWSIRALDGRFAGKVVAHAISLSLKDVEFQVSEAGRLRVLQTRQKNVHAYAVGALAFRHWDPDAQQRVTYNPYKAGHFVSDGKPIHRANVASLEADGKVWVDVQDTRGVP